MTLEGLTNPFTQTRKTAQAFNPRDPSNSTKFCVSAASVRPPRAEKFTYQLKELRLKLITSNMKAINLRNQHESPLLRLPPEIRVNVYTHVFSSHQIILSLYKFGMTRYEPYDEEDNDSDDDDDDQNNDDEENHEDEELMARKKRMNAIALRRTCNFIRQETDQIHHTTSTIKIWEIDQNPLLEKYLELPIVQHATNFWFKISMKMSTA